MLKEELGIELEYVKITEGYSLDMDDLEEKLKNPRVKIVSFTHVSNVTGEVFDLEKA
jgi:selenocysteine lyase/cysteine desulfurase